MTIEKFYAKLTKTDSCWLWTAGKYPNGYGSFQSQYAHRVSYQMHNGEIPKGQIVRHTCDVRECVNPEHLILGTHKDNTHDSVIRNRHHYKTITHCKNGHEFTEDNTYIYKGYMRVCITCKNERLKKYYHEGKTK